MPYSLEYTATAVRALNRIESHIARVSYPKTAANFVARIRARCQALCTAPLHGENHDTARQGMRSIGMAGSVSILYEIRNDSVRILAIKYQGQQLPGETKD